MVFAIFFSVGNNVSLAHLYNHNLQGKTAFKLQYADDVALIAHDKTLLDLVLQMESTTKCQEKLTITTTSPN